MDGGTVLCDVCISMQAIGETAKCHRQVRNSEAGYKMTES